MIKKEYMKPVMLIVEADFKQQILAGSVTSVATTGLGDGLNKDDNPGNIWNEAMSRNNTVWGEDEEE